MKKLSSVFYYPAALTIAKITILLFIVDLIKKQFQF